MKLKINKTKKYVYIISIIQTGIRKQNHCTEIQLRQKIQISISFKMCIIEYYKLKTLIDCKMRFIIITFITKVVKTDLTDVEASRSSAEAQACCKQIFLYMTKNIPLTLPRNK